MDPLSLLLAYRYWILFPLAVIEGPIIALLSGVLIASGHLSLLPTFLILLLSDVVPDTAYYLAGRFGHTQQFIARHAHKVGLSDRRLALVSTLWHEHTFTSMLLAKWAYGLSTPFLMSAGFTRVPYARYLFLTFAITLVDYMACVYAGYYFGQWYAVLATSIEYAGIILSAVILIVIVSFFLVGNYIRRRVLRSPGIL